MLIRIHKTKLMIIALTVIGIFVSTTVLTKDKELKVSQIYHNQAIDIAMKASGFNAIPKTIVSARREVLADDNTPLLRERIIGRPIWRVTIQNVPVWRHIIQSDKAKTSYRKETNPNISGFDVIVDAETGQVLKVASLWNAKTPPKEEIRVLISDQQLDKFFRINSQSFLDIIPEALPKITFLQAFKAAREGYGTHATHIEGIYVWYNHLNLRGMRERRRAWIVIHHGIPPYRPIAPPRLAGEKDIKVEAPAEARTVADDVIDAETGQWLGGGKMGGASDDYQKYIKQLK